jgi:hypothetical protein
MFLHLYLQSLIGYLLNQPAFVLCLCTDASIRVHAEWYLEGLAVWYKNLLNLLICYLLHISMILS